MVIWAAFKPELPAWSDGNAFGTSPQPGWEQAQGQQGWVALLWHWLTTPRRLIGIRPDWGKWNSICMSWPPIRALARQYVFNLCLLCRSIPGAGTFSWLGAISRQAIFMPAMTKDKTREYFLQTENVFYLTMAAKPLKYGKGPVFGHKLENFAANRTGQFRRGARSGHRAYLAAGFILGSYPWAQCSKYF